MIRERSDQELAGKAVDWMERSAISNISSKPRRLSLVIGYSLMVIEQSKSFEQHAILVGANFQLIVGQAHRVQECVPPRVVSEVRKVWVSPQTR
jgi:hypothetical protein